MEGMQNWQKGRPAKYDMETFDEVLVKNTTGFMDKAKKDGKPFFIWHNTTRMHVFTYLPPKYQAMMNDGTNYNVEEAGMAQMDDCIGEILKHLEDIGEADNTIVIFTTDNGAEVFTWPDGGQTPFKGTKGTSFEGGFRVPAIIRWPGHVKPGSVENGIISGLDWLPTLAAAAGNPNITEQLLKGRSSATAPTRTTSTATTSWRCWKVKDPPLVTNSSTSPARCSAQFGSTISSTRSSNSRTAGRERRSRQTCHQSPTCVRTPSSAPR